MRFQCQKCNAILELDDCLPGELVECDKCGEAVSVPETPTSPRAILGEFVIKRELGSGGMGTVYLAHQITLERDVALKVLMPELAADTEFINSFINEARAAAAINHPNIVQAYAVKRDGSIWYFAMEYIDGPTVKKLLEDQGKLPVEQTMQIANEIVSALRYAWNERKIIHRDIKPDNIMINSTGHAKLADLGLARKCTQSSNDTEGSDLFGTAQYVAPELLLSEPADPRSDIYSLGASLYQMLTGAFPYDGESTDEIVMKHLQTPLTPILEKNPAVPQAFATLVENMLTKRPAQRYQSYDELASDLDLVMAGNMPSKALPSTAQAPINLESENPLAIPANESETPQPDPPTSSGRSKKIKIGAKSNAPTLNSSTIALEDNELDELSEGGKGAVLVHQQKKTMKFVIPIVGVILLLAIAGAVLATRGSSDKAEELPPTPAETVATPAETTESSEAEAQTKDDAPSLDKLKKYVEQQNNDKAFDEMNALLVENTVPRSEVFAAIAPIIEDILKTERTNKFAEDDAIWSSTVEQVKKEIKELKAKEEAEKEEQRKKQEEEERAEKERKRLEERANAIKEEKLRRIAKLHENAEKNKLPSSILDFQIHFDDEDADLQKWRESWKGYIEKSSELMDAVSSFHVDEEQKKSNITLPVVIHYKSKKDATNEIDNYTTALMTLVKFDGEKATFEATKGMILQKMPDIQSRKFKSLPENLISFTVDFELLLPEQQIAITKAALAAAKESEGTDAATLVASSLISKGNFLHDIFENPVFEDFRSANDFVETLKAEQEYDANDELMAKHVKMLSQLLDECEKAPKALKTHIAETTIQRYLSSLSKSNATDELKEFMARYTKFANRN